MRSENNIGEQTGHTSVKVHQTPGGNSSLNLGWDDNSNQRNQRILIS